MIEQELSVRRGMPFHETEAPDQTREYQEYKEVVRGKDDIGTLDLTFKLKRSGKLGRLVKFSYDGKIQARVRDILDSQMGRRYGGFFSPRNEDLFRQQLSTITIGARNCGLLQDCTLLYFNHKKTKPGIDRQDATVSYSVDFSNTDPWGF